MDLRYAQDMNRCYVWREPIDSPPRPGNLQDSQSGRLNANALQPLTRSTGYHQNPEYGPPHCPVASLKTNTAVHVHGSDGIHAILTDDGVLDLYWGESKLYKSSAAAFKDCFEASRRIIEAAAHLLEYLDETSLVRIGSTMTYAFRRAQSGEDWRNWQLANLIVNWMKGTPFARLIDQRLRSSPSLTTAKAIRDVMVDVDSIARFHAPKYLSCYSGLLQVYAAELGETTANRTDYAMMLELGVSRTSEVVLMSLGLSRTATVAMSDFIGVDEWSRTEALEWLAVQNPGGLGVPVLLQREIREVLGRDI